MRICYPACLCSVWRIHGLSLSVPAKGGELGKCSDVASSAVEVPVRAPEMDPRVLWQQATDGVLPVTLGSRARMDTVLACRATPSSAKEVH